MKKPYPGYPPNYKIVDETGGFKRTCIVVELLSLGALSGAQLALAQEQLEATVERLKRSLAIVERSDVVLPDRFDPLLKAGLRLSRKH